MLKFLQVILISSILFLGGCAMFQPRTQEDNLAKLPKTPTQQLFQTIAKTNWLFTLSIVGVGAGFFAFLNGSSKGLQFMAACFVVISLIIGLARYSAWIAAIAMIGTVCLMVYSVRVKNKAMKEVVAGVQEVRSRSDAGPTDDHVILAALSSVQSKATEAIVKTIKNAL